MTESTIVPSSVTKPIQLLAAWLVGLLALNASFLTAAAKISHPSWAAGFLIICAAVNIPLFLACLFLLQTKFRPEMQEDQYYAKYLEKRVSVETGRAEFVELDIKRSSGSIQVLQEQKREVFLLSAQRRMPRKLKIQVNDLLPDYKEIRSLLEASKFKISSTFGSTSQDKEIPEVNLISIAHDVSLVDLQTILRILDGKIEYVGPANQLHEEGQIYIGSYAYKYDSIPKAKYTPGLRKKLLSDNLKQEDLFQLLGVEPIEDEEE